MARGKFIVVEGPDGTGKTCFTKALAHEMNKVSPTIALREPGGVAASEAIRNCALSPVVMEANGNTRMLLMFAARVQLCKEVVEPRLAQGTNVVCDRYALSTYVYQVLGEDADFQLFNALTLHITPVDTMFLLSAPFDVCYQRTLDRDQSGRNGYDDVSLGRKMEVWQRYDRVRATDVYDMGVTMLHRLDTTKTPTDALVEQAIRNL